MSKKIYVLILLVVLTSVVLTSTNVLSDQNGRTGRTRKTSTSGCSCHSSSSSISGVITTGGHDTVVAGQTYTFTLTITMPSGSGGYGTDIAAKTGTLAIISGQGLKLSGTELTHSSAISYSNPKSITFKYTAPATPGTDTIYANVDRGYSGAWAFVPNKGVKVVSATGLINNEIPVKYYLSQNFPNPFNPVTRINYGVMKSSNVKISVYDMLGKEVAVLVNGTQTAGNYYAIFEASKYSSGIYYYKIQTGDFTEVKKMSLIK
jgi:hypothetical protein